MAFAQLTPDALSSFAQERGGECLTRFVVSNADKIWWRCAKGHEWATSAASWLPERWCDHCRMGPRPPRQARRKREPVPMPCPNGHTWGSPGRAPRGACPHCRTEPVVENLRLLAHIAASHSGFCLTLGCASYDVPLTWRCRRGHQWAMTLAAATRGGWCGRCGPEEPASKPSRLALAQAIALMRRGECVTAIERRATEGYLWRCSRGHEFELTLTKALMGRWCAQCRGFRRLQRTPTPSCDGG